jgi:hypothetical protein
MSAKSATFRRARVTGMGHHSITVLWPARSRRMRRGSTGDCGRPPQQSCATSIDLGRSCSAARVTFHCHIKLRPAQGRASLPQGKEMGGHEIAARRGLHALLRPRRDRYERIEFFSWLIQ